MVKRTITITTILLILSIAISLIIILNKSSFAADGDIASGTSGTCSWVIDKNRTLIISPTDGVRGTLASSMTGNGPWYSNATDIKKVLVEEGVSAGEGCYKLFFQFIYCNEMDLANLDTSNVTNMAYMFQNCACTEPQGLSNWNTSNVITMENMFVNSHISNINIKSWDTSKVENMSRMFANCLRINRLVLSGWDTRSVTNMEGMFNNCHNMGSINVSGWNTQNVTNMAYMFCSCYYLNELDLSSFNTRNVTNMKGMFNGCAYLKKIDLSGFDTSNVNNMTNMFSCEKLQNVILSNTMTKWIDNAYLPNPSGENYTGKWVKEDEFVTPLTNEELYLQYPERSETLAGSWVWEKESYFVTYNYSGFRPTNASKLPAKQTYAYGEEVIISKPATAIGYDFSGWDRTGPFVMLGQDITISGYFTPSSNTPYKVEYYLEDLNSNTYTLENTENLSGTTDSEIIAETKQYEGFTYNSSIDGSKSTGTIAGDGSLVLKLYYKRNSYRVTYEYIGEIPDGASKLPGRAKYEYGEEVSVAEEAIAEGYTFSGWSIKDNFEMPAENVVITGSFTPVTDTADNTDEKEETEKPTNQDKEENTTIEQNSTIIDNIETNIKNQDKGVLNPKTDDVMNKYLLAGIGGIIVLALVSKIRRKYSSKARKIQF